MMVKDGPVYCDCCGTVVMAVIQGGILTILDKRKGRKHIVSQDLTILAKKG